MTTLRRNRVDLHTHTRRSDGVLAPLELFGQMAAYGMALVAITDHDTLAGAAELRAAGVGDVRDPGAPGLITGVEINTVGGDVLGRHGLGRDGEDRPTARRGRRRRFHGPRWRRGREHRR